MNVVREEIELKVITPNEPGIFGRVLATLANAGINLRAYCVQSEKHQEKGQFNLVTSDHKKAEAALRSLGYKIKTTKVITVEVDDRAVLQIGHGQNGRIGRSVGQNVNITIGKCAGQGDRLTDRSRAIAVQLNAVSRQIDIAASAVVDFDSFVEAAAFDVFRHE